MRSAKTIIFALVAVGFFIGCASSTTKPKFKGSLHELLVDGSPWIVNWDTVTGSRGRFNESLTANVDGSLTAKSDEVGSSTDRQTDAQSW